MRTHLPAISFNSATRRGASRVQFPMLVLLCISTLLSTSCGQPEETAAPSASSSGDRAVKSAARSFELDIDACGGFGVADAARILGVDVAVVEQSSQPLEDGKWCVFSNTEDYALGVNFSLTRADTEKDAIDEFVQFQGHAEIAVGTIGDAGDSIRRVAGVGDEAIWAPVPGAVHVRKGRYTLQVNSPGDEQMQIEVAKAVLGES